MKRLIFLMIISLLVVSCTDNAEAPKNDQIANDTMEETMENTFTEPLAIFVWQNKDGSSEDTMIIRFYRESAPNHVDNFIKLATSGFYNGNVIFRVEPGFVIQTGSPTDDATGGPGYTIDAEFNEIKHLTGTLAMARAMDPNSAGSQYYFTLAPQPGLDNKYTVFGQIIENVELLGNIAKGDYVKEITIIEAEERYGENYIDSLKEKDLHNKQ